MPFFQHANRSSKHFKFSTFYVDLYDVWQWKALRKPIKRYGHNGLLLRGASGLR